MENNYSNNTNELNNFESIKSKKKKHCKKNIYFFIIILIIVIGILLVLIYHPRSISKYINSESNKLVKIEVVYIDEEIFDIDETDSISFLNELLDTKVSTSYLFVQKVISPYTIYLYYEDSTYQLNNYYLYNGKTRIYFNYISNNLNGICLKYIGDLN